MTSSSRSTESPATGTYEDPNSAFEGDIILNADGSIAFESNLPVDAVYIKGGNEGGNLYVYDPAVTSDTGLGYAYRPGDQPHLLLLPRRTRRDSVADTEPDSVADTEPDSVADTEPDSVADTEPDSVADTEPDSVADTEPDSVADTEPDSVADTEPDSVADTSRERARWHANPVADADAGPDASRERARWEPDADAGRAEYGGRSRRSGIEHGPGLRPRRDPRAGGDDLRQARPWARTPLIIDAVS